MLTGVLWGAALGAGTWLVVRGIAPSRPPLAVALAELTRPRWENTQADGHWWRVRMGRAASMLSEELALDLHATRRDLAMVGRSLERHALDKLAMAALGLALPVVVWALVEAGGAGLAPGMVVIASLACAAGGFVYPDIALRAEASARRRDFRHALGAFLDLVTIVLAGGGGVEGALEAAAQTGDGWAFARIRQSLALARLNREPPWAALDRLAAEQGTPELAELTSSIALAGVAGAKVRASLAAKAASLRDHELAEAETAAESASERMAGPVVAMVVGFIVLIGYPALANVLSL